MKANHSKLAAAALAGLFAAGSASAVSSVENGSSSFDVIGEKEKCSGKEGCEGKEKKDGDKEEKEKCSGKDGCEGKEKKESFIL
jgi:hypothetical protein